MYFYVLSIASQPGPPDNQDIWTNFYGAHYVQ